MCGQAPRLTVKKRGPGRPWKLCLNDDCPTMVEMREKRAERERQKAEREAAKAAAENGAAGTDGEAATEMAETAGTASAGASRRRPPRKKPDPGTKRTKRARSSSKR